MATLEERIAEFNKKYAELCKEYQMEIRPQINLNLFDMAPKEQPVEEVKPLEESPKEAEIEETPEKQA